MTAEIERLAASIAESLAAAGDQVRASVQAAAKIKLPPMPEMTPPRPLEARIRDLLLRMSGWVDGDEITAEGSDNNDLAAERVDAMIAFINLAKVHSMPRKLLPRGDHPGDHFEVGTDVEVYGGALIGTVVYRPDTVAVQLPGVHVGDLGSDVVEFPRSAIRLAEK